MTSQLQLVIGKMRILKTYRAVKKMPGCEIIQEQYFSIWLQDDSEIDQDK